VGHQRVTSRFAGIEHPVNVDRRLLTFDGVDRVGKISNALRACALQGEVAER
jgi:hypothetical protein